MLTIFHRFASCSGLSYPIAGLSTWTKSGYGSDHPITPHGISVALR